MFSSFTKSMKSLVKGPRAVLAENIAQALAEHFVLDPEDIESSLLKDARIVLKNTSLRPRRYRTPDAPNAVISVEGVVEEVIFSWRWSLTGGGKATSSQESSSGYATGGGMVQDAILTIKGLKVRIGLEAFDDLDKKEQLKFICESLESTSIHESNASNGAKDEASSKSQKEGYIQTYMQQIVDHLTLKIEDFEFIIQPANGPSITIGGNDIELGTLASAKMPANKDEEGATTTTVLSQKLLIRSFSIHASDGISEEHYPLIESFGYAVSVTRLSGMRFQGGILSGLEIIGLLQPPEEYGDVQHTSMDDYQTNEGIVFHIGRPQIQALSAIGMLLAPASEPAAVVSSPSSDDKDDAKKCSSSTLFNLPLPALTLVLSVSGEPNARSATKITLPTATVVYRTDGKVFNIMGLGGIKDNGEPLISLADGGKWIVDFVNKSFVLEDASSGGSTINISDEAVMRISSSVAALLASDEVLKLQNAWEGQESAVAVQDQDLKSQSWSISTGAMTLRLTSDTKWLEATIAHFRTVLSLGGVHGYTPTEAKVGGIVIRTSSSNTAIVTAPPFTLLSDVLLVPGTIEASIESVDKALEIKEFLLSFLEMTNSEQDSPAADSSSGIHALPFAVQLECVKCSVQDSDVDVHLKNIIGVGVSFKCEKVIMRAERLKVELHKSNVTFPPFSSRQDQNSPDSISLGFSSDRVLIYFHDTPDHANVTGMVRSTLVKTNVSILVGSSLKIKLVEMICLRMEDSKGGWVDGLIDVSEVILILDDLLHPQSLECAGAKITSSSFGLIKISVPPLVLSPTNEGSTIRIGQMKNDAVDVELGSIDIIEQAQEMFTAALGESAENKGTSDASFSVPFPIQIPRINLSVGDPFVKVNMESVAVAYEDINIDSIKCKGPNDTSSTLRSINLKLGMAIAVQIGMIEDIIIPYVARFAEPIENAVIIYNGNSLSMELDSVQVQMLKYILGDNKPPNGDDGEGFFEIPFPLNVNIKNFNLSSVPKEDMSLQAAGIKMKIESINGLVNIDTNDVMSIRVVHKNEWLQYSLYPTFIALPKTLTTIIAMTCGGVSVDNCSLGLVHATLPPCTLLPEDDCVVANEALVVKIESSEVLQKLQGFVSGTSSQIEKKSSEQSPASTPLPIVFTLAKLDFSIQDPPMQLIGTTIFLKDFLFKCASVSCKEVSGMSASIQAVEGNLLGSNVHVQVGRVSSLDIPGVFKLSTPVEDTSIAYKREEGVLIDVNTVRGTFERPKTRKVQDSSDEHCSLSIPFPIQFNMKSLGLKDLDSHLMIAINNISFSVSQTGSIYSLKTRDGIPMRFTRSPDEWINAKLGSISLLLVQDNGCFKPHEMQFSGGTIGPSCSPSGGELSIEIPPMQKDSGSLPLSFQSNMSMTVDSVDIFEKLRPLFESIVGPQDESSTFDKFPFPVQIPGIKIFVSKTLLRIQIGSISAFESSVNIEHVHAINRVHVDSSNSTCMKGLRMNIPTKRFEVSCVESLTTPVFALSKQLVNLGLSFENEVLAINIPSPIYLDMLSGGANTQQEAPRSQENDIDIPFPLKIAIAEVNVNTLISGSNSCVKMQQISCDIVPKVLPGQDLLSAEVKKGAQIAIILSAVEHQLFKARNIRASLLIGLDDMETCNNLNVSLTSAQVTAGFSSIDWTSMFDKTASENNTQKTVVKTPFANITGFSLSIAYKGMVVASGATIAVPTFGGNAFTTSHDLTSYYTNVVLKRAPGFLTNAEVLGTNVIDSTFANAGRVAMQTKSLAGAGFGSVVGTVVADGFKGAISAGKTSRNADTGDGYQFGDVSRGLVRGLSQATKKGAESRGGGDGYVPGDFTVGAATAAADYTGRNKGKLASAGGAGMGSMVGMAVAGPLGFVVGSYLGGKAGKAAVEEDATSANVSAQDAYQESNSDRQPQQTTYQAGSPYQHQQKRFQGGNQPHYPARSTTGSNIILSPPPHAFNNATPVQTQQYNPPTHNQAQQQSQAQAQHYPRQTQQQTQARSLPPQQYQQASNQQQAQAHYYPRQTQQYNPSTHNQAQHYPRQTQQQTQARSLPPQQYQQASNQQQAQAHHYPRQTHHQQYNPPTHNQAQHYPRQTQQQTQARSLPPQQYQQASNQQQAHAHHYPRQTHHQQPQVPQRGYQFGDFTRSKLAKGKEADGRGKNDGYKFGDFSRGLFK